MLHIEHGTPYMCTYMFYQCTTCSCMYARVHISTSTHIFSPHAMRISPSPPNVRVLGQGIANCARMIIVFSPENCVLLTPRTDHVQECFRQTPFRTPTSSLCLSFSRLLSTRPSLPTSSLPTLPASFLLSALFETRPLQQPRYPQRTFSIALHLLCLVLVLT